MIFRYHKSGEGMLKINKNDISNIRREDDCIPYRDCTAHNAAAEDLAIAKSNLITAQNNLSNAEALKSSLNEEMGNVKEALGNYKSVFDSITSCGRTAASPSIMGGNGLSGMIDCLSKYGSQVESAFNASVNEVRRCTAEVHKCEVAVSKAEVKLANTPCVWKCS